MDDAMRDACMPFDLDSNPFWDFSVRFYRQPGVAPACLRLQDSLGIDVNLLLFGAWSAAAGEAELDRATCAELLRGTAAWHEVVRAMRSARRRVKEGHRHLSQDEAGSAYRRVLAAELEIERYEQLIIMRAAGRRPPAAPHASSAAQRARRNMELYLDVARAAPGDDDRAALDVIAAAVTDDALPG